MARRHRSNFGLDVRGKMRKTTDAQPRRLRVQALQSRNRRQAGLRISRGERSCKQRARLRSTPEVSADTSAKPTRRRHGFARARLRMRPRAAAAAPLAVARHALGVEDDLDPARGGPQPLSPPALLAALLALLPLAGSGKRRRAVLEATRRPGPRPRPLCFPVSGGSAGACSAKDPHDVDDAGRKKMAGGPQRCWREN